ncbi:hypothetical protein CNYM01_10617 [Colletotrichum nymphaeae SA-01]|uniref:BTB domain-containing protein n=1 Tax=Colletotrichum nymphaeae SA-01 TaxID=1460502 RepID=A0A135RYP8_9PEZI|nr:hypothetical protein CNYM01_10617 [Colletotrichum nymphaeae SA-01]
MSLKRKRGIDEIIDSRIVTFIIGKGDSKREFFVLEGALARLSAPLRALLTGGMQEALEGKIIWDDIEPTTFRLLLEYAYTGFYPIPYPGKRNDDERGSEEDGDTREEIEEDRSLRLWIKNSAEQDNERHAVLDFCEEHFSEYEVSEVASANRVHSARKHGSEVLDSTIIVELDHLLKPSQLYILADRYLIYDLKKSCLNDVGRKLCNADGDRTLMTHVCSVLRFLHEQTLPQDKLRKLFLRFLIADMEYAMASGGEDLIRDFADYAVELLLEIPRTYWKELQDA